jgi:hypothetical protein
VSKQSPNNQAVYDLDLQIRQYTIHTSSSQTSSAYPVYRVIRKIDRLTGSRLSSPSLSLSEVPSLRLRLRPHSLSTSEADSDLGSWGKFQKVRKLESSINKHNPSSFSSLPTHSTPSKSIQNGLPHILQSSPIAIGEATPRSCAQNLCLCHQRLFQTYGPCCCSFRSTGQRSQDY